jgi:hypothetical protein
MLHGRLDRSPEAGLALPNESIVRPALALAFQKTMPASPTHRTPILLFRFSGSFLLRFDTRAFLELLFHEPPRSVGFAPSSVSQKIFERLRRLAKGKRGKI